jgi:hypothetical protein
MTVATPLTEVNDIVDNADERELWIVGREFERPPYFHAGKGGDTRLARALRVCVEGRITPNSDGSYTVEGSEHRSYRVTNSCSCPQSQKANSKFCYHYVAVCLYVEWKRRLQPIAPPFSPVALGTLRAGTLPLPEDDEALGNGYPVDDETLPVPLPPVSAEERLAQSPTLAERQHNYTQAALPPTPDDNDPQYLTPTLPQEDTMPADDYIPEPDTEDAPVTVLDAPVPPRVLTPIPPQVLDLEVALQTWTTERAVVRRFLKQELQANIDYYTLRIGSKDSKPSLSKAGAEKVMGWLKLQASFTPDTGTWEMLGKPQDLVCYVCTLRTRSGEIVGEGRGARSIKKDGGDVNKAIKMAEKSANVSAVLRTGCLSDVFTSDLEDMQEPEPAKPAPTAKPTAADLRMRIWKIVQARDTTVKTREDVESFIKARTGMDLHPDFYQAIVSRLEEGR